MHGLTVVGRVWAWTVPPSTPLASTPTVGGPRDLPWQVVTPTVDVHGVHTVHGSERTGEKNSRARNTVASPERARAVTTIEHASGSDAPCGAAHRRHRLVTRDRTSSRRGAKARGNGWGTPRIARSFTADPRDRVQHRARTSTIGVVGPTVDVVANVRRFDVIRGAATCRHHVARAFTSRTTPTSVDAVDASTGNVARLALLNLRTIGGA